MAGVQGDPWRVTEAERAKHDAQFFQLKPVGGFISGEQARGFFMQSGLPVPILGLIWGLADMNADGKMDKKEFSIAMHLIAKKLQGMEVPRALPAALKSDPTATNLGAMGQTPQPMGYGTLPHSPAPSSLPPIGYNTLPPMGLSNGGPMSYSAGYNIGAASGPPAGGFGLTTTSFPQTTPTQAGVGGSDWGIPQAQRMRYNQMFSAEDRTRKGHLTGFEAKAILSKTGLPHTVLAQIWSLADLDSDGKLTSDEFSVCMYLVDMANSGQLIPGKLPLELVPPAYRKGPAGGAVGLPPGGVPGLVSSAPITSPGGFNMGAPPIAPAQEMAPEPDILSALSLATFEDKRKANFDKGQAELDRRRALLREEQQRMEEERMAAEKAEFEKREKKRLEQERKKHMEMEKHMEKQRQVEQEREEARRKALEQREAARRELERQRQLEWERQRRDQLMVEKSREQANVDRLHSEVGELKFELETLDNRKVELHEKIEQARHNVTDFTSAIDSMRLSRDIKLADIEQFQVEVLEWQNKVGAVQYERQQLDIKVQAQNEMMDDSYKTVMHSYNNKKDHIEKLKAKLSDLEKDTATKVAEFDNNNTQLNEINNKMNDLQSANNKLQTSLEDKRSEWGRMKEEKAMAAKEESGKVNGFSSWGFDAGTTSAAVSKSVSSTTSSQSLQDTWAAFNIASPTTATTTTTTTTLNNKDTDVWGSAFSANDLYSKPRSHSATPASRSAALSATPTLGTKSVTPPASDPFRNNVTASAGGSMFTNTDAAAGASVWANFEEKPDLFSSSQPSNSSQASSSWADAFFTQSSKKGGSTTEAVFAGGEGKPGYTKYQAMFQFDARNPDELSLTPGEVVWIKPDQTGAEPGWMVGECNGKEGWFPEAYVQASTTTSPDTMSPSQAEQLPVQSPQQDGFGQGFGTESFGNGAVPDVPSISVGGIAENQAPSNGAQSTAFTPVPTSAPAGSPTPGLGQSAPDGLQAQALYPWKAKKDNHLTFNKGDIIIIQEQQDMWWSGELAGNTGWFPKSYVKLIGSSANSNKVDEPVVEASPPQVDVMSPTLDLPGTPGTPGTPDAFSGQGEPHVALYAYQSTESGDLIFNQGDTVCVIKMDGDWWTGVCGDRTGIFPANYVKKVEQPAAQDTQPAQMLSSVKKPEIASVIAPYQATGPEQLSLTQGQLILVRKKSNSGWWEGELQARGQKRKIGWFPANYVTLRGSSSSRTTPDGQRASPQKSLSPTPQPTDQGSRSTTPVSYPQPTTAPALEQVVALYNYTSQHEDELSFHKGSIINVISKSDPDWWKGELNGQTGVFPANYVSPLSEVDQQNVTLDSSTAWSQNYEGIAFTTTPGEQKRQNCIGELIDTEESYMADLLLVRDVFYKPFNQLKVLTDEEKQIMFVNWKELVMCSTKFLKSLRVRKQMSQNKFIQVIGDILCENIPHMTPYIRFCSCQLNAANLIQQKTENDKKFQDAHKRCWMDTRTKGMPLSSYLLKPLQRITKYPLLIEKILEHTPPEHPDHHNLQEAFSKAQELCSQVNEGVREKENSDKLEWIQTHVVCDGLPEKISFNTVTNCLGPRKFLYSGTLYKAKSGKELVGLLFNDFLLLTQPQKSVGNMSTVFSFDVKANVTFKMYRNPIFLNEVMVKKPTDQEHADINILFHLHHIERIYSLKAINPSERDSWAKRIEAASKTYLETERKKREKAHSVRRAPAVGRLLVVIIEGQALVTGEHGKSDPYCEVSMGAQEHKTKVINSTLNPKWNASMQFTIRDLQEDVLCITVYDRDLFTPNDFLGRTEIRIQEILQETRNSKGPITKHLKLYEVDSGEVVVKLDLQLFDNS